MEGVNTAAIFTFLRRSNDSLLGREANGRGGGPGAMAGSPQRAGRATTPGKGEVRAESRSLFRGDEVTSGSLQPRSVILRRT